METMEARLQLILSAISGIVMSVARRAVIRRTQSSVK
jgi:hypothetical protein